MRGKTLKLSTVLSGMIFLSMHVTALLSISMMSALLSAGVRGIVMILSVAAACTSAALLIPRLFSRRLLTVLTGMNQAAGEVAKGNFDITLDENIPVEELRDMAHSFNRMTRELAGTELLRSDFVENVSHEFKTPLSAIEGYATLLQKPGLSGEKRSEYTAKILYNTKRLSTLTSSILLLSRLENQELDIPRETFCLDEQLREVILSQEESWSGKGLELDVDLDSADYWGNRDLLAHVWQNLLGNAVKFTPEGGQIRIRLRREDGGVLVSVADSGPGMSEDVRQRVFEKFYQGDPSRASQGAGLGLSLAKRIVDLYRGEISVSSRQGSGTVFTVRLHFQKPQ